MTAIFRVQLLEIFSLKFFKHRLPADANEASLPLDANRQSNRRSAIRSTPTANPIAGPQFARRQPPNNNRRLSEPTRQQSADPDLSEAGSRADRYPPTACNPP